jgi:hypothetical protein
MMTGSGLHDWYFFYDSAGFTDFFYESVGFFYSVDDRKSAETQ